MVDEKLLEYVQGDGSRYKASLLRRDDSFSLDSFRNSALHRFETLKNKLLKDPTSLLRFDAAESCAMMPQKVIRAGFVERVDKKNCTAYKVYYMPHTPVYREDKTSITLRIVCHASASVKGNKSLNGCLLTGPNLLLEVLTILLNFRIGQ